MTDLHLYNTLTAQKQKFTPIVAGKVGMYVCGMTVYDYCHIGHARVMIGFDVIYRWLMKLGYDVNYVRNITDIDDKIIKRAGENGESIYELTDRFIKAMHEDADKLGCLRPTNEPKATDYINQMQELIGKLQAKNLAYQGTGGDVYYAVENFDGYGKLSKRKLADMVAGASERVDAVDDKKHPFDFVLWKSAKESEPTETKWQSPWGVGRPGWHIECSAMSTCCLGESFDIHGGGHDLQFPHHENEIAQSEGATGKTYANNWLHMGFVNIDGEKMSKSLNNFFTVREVLDNFHAETVRFFVISSHYRSPINYSDVALMEAERTLLKLYYFRRDCIAFEGQFWWEILEVKGELKKIVGEGYFYKEFVNAMNDDFNTVKAISCIMQLLKEIENIKQQTREYCSFSSQGSIDNIMRGNISNYLSLIQDFNVMTGALNLCSPNKGGTQPKGKVRKFIKYFEKKYKTSHTKYLTDKEVDELVNRRAEAKKHKDFALADQIRFDLKEQGIELEDKRNGLTSWRRI